MTALSDFDVTVVLHGESEFRVITVRLPAGSQDLALVAGCDIGAAIVRACNDQLQLAPRGAPVQAVPAPAARIGDRVHLPPRFGPIAAEIGEVLDLDHEGVAEVEIRSRPYGNFYVPGVELRPCAPRRDLDRVIDAVTAAVMRPDGTLDPDAAVAAGRHIAHRALAPARAMRAAAEAAGVPLAEPHKG